ncbi:hypothetical protein [Rhizobium laguerreae]|uniref:hypothetical protein n=1 Tax=Rhizobium laguerreae TaxID=1076926 RepID=UPI0028B1EF3B|nr:hypothetical protein [Rhizobium laguerreae]
MGDQDLVGVAANWRAVDVLPKCPEDHPGTRNLTGGPLHAIARCGLLKARGFIPSQADDLSALDEFERGRINDLNLAVDLTRHIGRAALREQRRRDHYEP